MKNISIDGKRLWESLMDMAKIGATEKGGNCRLALTDLDREGRDLFVRWCEAAGCRITVDAMGNIFARRPGRFDEQSPVMTGSHLDTQPTGGRFDGVYGVLAGLEVIRTLNDHEIVTDSPVEVVVWTNEEGARFAPSMIASGVFAGVFEQDYAHRLTDIDGKTFGDELARIGYKGEAACGGRDVKAYFEAHIEQGPILEAENKPVGVVLGAQAQRWFDVTVIGAESHAGTTPMDRRRDALVGTAKLVLEVQRLATTRPPHAVTTVGHMQVGPNSRNTIPGSVFLTVDLRHPSDDELHMMAGELRAQAARIAAEGGLDISIEEITHMPPVVFDADCIAAVRQGAEALGYDHRDIISGAGHDACYINRVAPTAMIFVPCKDGISHNEIESAEPEDLAAGCNVLLHAMLERAEG